MSNPRGRARPVYLCTDCGHEAPKWLGQCPGCGSWGTVTEQAPPPPALRRVGGVAGPAGQAVRLTEIDTSPVRSRPSGVAEFDRVLGGGLVPGGVVLLAGEPGVGKSTLLLAAAAAWARAGHGRALIVTGEETAGQVRLRAERLGAVHEDVYLAAESNLGAALAQIEEIAPTLVVLDSVQTVADPTVEGTTGGVAQVRAVSAALTALAKERGFACVLVGHVTKDGAIAGPRVLEHLVDVVLHFEGEKNSTLRMVRGVKNRFGPADEVGCFAMTAAGIESLPDPSGLFLSARRGGVAGTCSAVTMQGRRALPVELQTLAGPPGSAGARTVSGLDPARVAMVMAIADRWAGLGLAGREVLAATVGGVRVVEPAMDLPLAMAVWSSVRDIPLPPTLVAIGELGLSGELRPVPAAQPRLAEAARLGFTEAIVPAGDYPEVPAGMRLHRAEDLRTALRSLADGTAGVAQLA